MRLYKSHRFQHGGRKIQPCMRCSAQRRWNQSKKRYQYRALTVPDIKTSYGVWSDVKPQCFALSEDYQPTLKERVAALEQRVDVLEHDLRAARDRISDLESRQS